MATVTPDCNPCSFAHQAQANDQVNAPDDNHSIVTNDDNDRERVVDNEYFIYSMVIFGVLSLLIIVGLIWKWRYHKKHKKLKGELENIEKENENDQIEEEPDCDAALV